MLVLWISLYSYGRRVIAKENEKTSVCRSAGRVMNCDCFRTGWASSSRSLMVEAQTENSALLRNPSGAALSWGTNRSDRQHPEKIHLHILQREFTASSLTQVLRVDKRGLSSRARPSTSHRSSAADLVVKLSTGDVHLMQGWIQALGQHAGAIGVQVEGAFVARDRLVHVALVALALVVRLTDTKVNSLLELHLVKSVKPLRFGSVPTLSSRPSDRMTTILPCRLRPVRPIRCTRRVGFFCASKQTMRSTSPISNPSSPTQVDTSVLKPPWRNLCTT